MTSFTVKTFKGKETAPYLTALAEMRVSEFFNFPYLYVGTVEEDEQYSQIYRDIDESMLVIAFEGEKIAGLYSGMPFSAPVSFTKLFKSQAKTYGIDLRQAYYSGELIIEKPYRKKGLGSQLMNRFFEEAEKMNYKTLAGITAIRPQDHPFRPHNYADTDLVWPKNGFEKTEAMLSIDYPTRQADGSVADERNSMALWGRQL